MTIAKFRKILNKLSGEQSQHSKLKNIFPVNEISMKLPADWLKVELLLSQPIVLKNNGISKTASGLNFRRAGH